MAIKTTINGIIRCSQSVSDFFPKNDQDVFKKQPLPKLVNKQYGRAKMRKKKHIVGKKSKRKWKKKV